MEEDNSQITKIPTISKFQILINAFRLHKNPLPVIMDTMATLNTKSYRASLGMKLNTLVTKDPVIIQHVLQKNNKNYYKSEIQTKILGRFLGKGLLTSNGEYWLKQRRLIQPGFHKKNLESFLKIMQDEVIIFFSEYKHLVDSNKIHLDINEEMSKLTMRVVSRALFNSDITDEEISFIRRVVDQLQDAITKDIRLPFLKSWRTLTGEEKENDLLAKQISDLLISKINLRRNSTENYDDLLDMLLSVRYEESGKGMTDQQLIDEILIIYVAGYETTANALSWTLKLLDEHPDILEKVLTEFNSIDLTNDFSFEDARKFEYTLQVISESMRLYPPAWIVDRVALADDKVNGVKIHKGEIISIFTYGVHHDEEYWDDSEMFNPSRFERTNQKSFQPFSYFPFGGGPRLCIGNQFANMEMILTLYYLLKDYKLELVKPQNIELRPLVTLKPKTGIKMKLTKRDK